jgi:hypothetical protein
MADHRAKGLSSALCYKDSKAAFRWLEEAFGFEPIFVLLDEQGNLAHSEMGYGASTLMVETNGQTIIVAPRTLVARTARRCMSNSTPARISTLIAKGLVPPGPRSSPNLKPILMATAPVVPGP